MFKLLFVLPLMFIGTLVAFGAVLPLLALLPLVLVLGAGMLALAIGVGVVGLVVRIVFGLMLGVGFLLAGALGFGFLFAGGAAVLAIGVALSHLLVPILLIVGLVWLIRRGSRPTPSLPPPAARA